MGEPGFKFSSDWQSLSVPTESTRSLARKTRHRINHICTDEINHIDTDGNWAQCITPTAWDAEPSEARGESATTELEEALQEKSDDEVGDAKSSPPLSHLKAGRRIFAARLMSSVHAG